MIFVNQVIMSVFCFENSKVLRSMRKRVLRFLSHHFFLIKSGSLDKKAEKENHRILEDKPRECSKLANTENCN